MAISEVFNELIKGLDDGFIRNNIYMLDKTLLAKAAKTIEPQALEKVFNNISKEEAEEIKRRIAALGPVRLEEVEEAQETIIRMIRG
jgi:flagellar motor switch protein FliG